MGRVEDALELRVCRAAFKDVSLKFSEVTENFVKMTKLYADSVQYVAELEAEIARLKGDTK